MLPGSKTRPVSSAASARRLRILVVNTSPQLPLAFPDAGPGDMAITRKRLTQVPPAKWDGYGLVVAETPAEWEKDGSRLRRLIEGKPQSYFIIAPAPLLQQTAAHIHALGRVLSAPPGDKSKVPALHPDGDFLDGFVRKKLRTFVHAFSASGGRDLYGCLMKEVERPLIMFALEETGGNQGRAAELLGLNRNTLRKRIQECRIQIEEKPSGRKSSR